MTSTSTARPVRPANRRALIADAAGRAFSERGYHAVAMDDIASAVGITAAALYRHFPNKYALFVECANQLANGLAATLDGLPAEASLVEMFEAIARVTVANRATGGLYRWEARYLQDADRKALRATFRRIVDRVSAAIAEARPDGDILSDEDLRLLASASLGAIGSATAHRTTIGARRLESLLVGAARRVALTELASADAASDSVGVPERAAAPPPAKLTRKQQILDAAVPLFHRDGYAEVSMADIAREVGLTPSGLYRHYTGKADILYAACMQAADLLNDKVQLGLANSTTLDDGLRAITTAYVSYSFQHTALTSVATAESGGLPPEYQRPIKSAQRDFVDQWAHQLRATDSSLAPLDARILVHAALGVITEAGRVVQWTKPASNRLAGLALAAVNVPY